MDNEPKAVAAHLRQSPSDGERIGNPARLERDEERSKMPRASSRWWLAAAAMVLLALAAAWNRHFSDPLAKLQPDKNRRIEARLTFFNYAPYIGPRRGEDSQADLTALTAGASVQKAAKADRTPENLHRYALAQLALGGPSHAVDLLQEASNAEPENASLLSDLAAAQLATGLPADGAENAAKALQRDPSLAPAAFNWALALEALSNRPAAIEAWKKYLLLDGTSEWAKEAREHYARLTAPRSTWDRDKPLLRPGADTATIHGVVDRYPQRVRNWVQDDLLPRWLGTGRPEDLTLLRAIGERRAANGDPFLLDVVQQATTAGVEFRSAIALLAAARALPASTNAAVAAGQFRDASQALRNTGSPLALSAEIAVARSEYYGGQLDAALAHLTALESSIDPPGKYPAITAEMAWVRGLVTYRLGRLNDSLESYRRGIAAAEKGHEVELVAGLEVLAAEDLDRIADRNEADRYRTEALRHLDESDPPSQRRYTAFSTSAYAELWAGRPRLALAFIESQRALADQDPLLLGESDAARALALRDLGDIRGAQAAVASARAHAVRIPTPALRDRSVSNISYIGGTLDAQTNPALAVAELSDALRIWQSYSWRVHSAPAFLLRGEAHLATGDRPAAERDFRAGAEQMERERGELGEPMRVAYFERADHVFTRLIALLIDEKRFGEALTVAERKRSRELLDKIAANAGETAQPLDSSALSSAIGPSVALVEYMLLDDGPAIWVVRQNGVTFARGTASRNELESAIERQSSAIGKNDAGAIQREGRFLFAQLIGPVAFDLDPSDTIVFVPDGALESLPFAALVGPDGRYLLEQHAIARAASGSTFAKAISTKTNLGGLLAVAQPAPGGNLEVLPGAAAEINEIAVLYGTRGYVGQDITPTQFLTLASSAATVQFAGHTRVDLRHPAQSALLFASAGGESVEPLTAAAIAANPLSRKPLVILAACSTGVGTLRRNESADSLALAFLHAGARGVVATLWDVDDKQSATLYRLFHRNLRQGDTASAALRTAQLSLLRSRNPLDCSPSSWTGAVLIGTV
jgi:CHAT domain-containing protein